VQSERLLLLFFKIKFKAAAFEPTFCKKLAAAFKDLKNLGFLSLIPG
jgi:hypothetical protein